MTLAFPKPVREPRPRKPLARRTRLKAKGKTSHARRPRDFSYMGEVVKLPCSVYTLSSDFMRVKCAGRVQVDHAFGRYRPGSDTETIPLCEKHHREKTGIVGGEGFMHGWSLALRRGWLELAIAVTRAAVGARQRREAT